MRIDADLHYAAPCDRASAVTFDPDFQKAKCAATGALSSDVDVHTAGDSTVIKTVRRMPTDGLPDFARALVKGSITVTETDTWGPPSADGSRDASVEVSFVGAPITMRGTIALRPDGPGSTGRFRAELKASIPFLGARIEQACAPAVLSAVKVEERTAADWLSRT